MIQTTATKNGKAEEEAVALLRESATPDLYYRNGFRVLELPVDATAKDVNRRKQLVEMAATNGVQLPPGPGRSFPLEPAPDEFTVRDAVQRLGDPERRLVDEFFWFWPHEQGQSKSDQGLQHLTQGNYERASEIWSQQEANQSVSHVSTHNLAVLHHLLALQWESYARSSEVNGDERKNIEQLWSRAFRRWQKLLDEECFWSRLTARVREFEDPRLTAGTVRRLRSALPAALLSINARLALQAVEQGKKDSAARLVEVIRKSGFPEDAIKDGFCQAVEPVRVRIKALCKAADNSAESDPVHADKACRQLLDNAIPLLDGLDCLLPAGNPTRDVAHDDVAEQALRCQVAFAKKTQNWKVSAELLELAAIVASSESVSKKLKENLETVKKNTENNDDYCGEGYFDLPAQVLEELEAARKLADSQDFDGAVSRLEKLLSTLDTTHAPLVNKSLAYCLGFRGIRRLNESSQGADEIPQTLKKALILSQMGGNLFRGFGSLGNRMCAACGGMLYGQYYTMTFRGINMQLCVRCHGEIKSEEETRKSKIKNVVRKSAEDFVRAGKLDPANKFVQKQIEQVREICSKIGVSFPSPGSINAKTGKSSNCFIATAAYGSPLATEVDILRQFRDETLRLFVAGRLFIRTYESISPPFARWLSGHNRLRAVVRSCLAPVIWLVKMSRTKRSCATSGNTSTLDDNSFNTPITP